MKQFLGTLMLG